MAKINSKGKITFKKPGTVTITATATDGSGIKATTSISVEPIPVSNVTISGEKVVKVGSSIKLTAKVSPSNASYKKVKWSCYDTSIATVDSNGKVKGKKAGTTYIYAKATDEFGELAYYKIKVIKKNADPAASKIVKKTTSVKTKAEGGKKVKVSWKGDGNAIRYEVQIASDKKFTKTLVVTKAKKGTDNISIKYKKTGNAYVRVRAVDKYGYVGEWSSIKQVKVK